MKQKTKVNGVQNHMIYVEGPSLSQNRLANSLSPYNVIQGYRWKGKE